MAKIFMVACPKCGFSYPVDEILMQSRVDAHCPSCHHEFRPDAAGGGTAQAARQS